MGMEAGLLRRGLFKEFFEPLSSSERNKVRFIDYVSRIWKGSYLYFMRGIYVRYFVLNKGKVNLQGVIRFIYAD